MSRENHKHMICFKILLFGKMLKNVEIYAIIHMQGCEYMRFFRNILLCIIIELLATVTQIANMFLSNVAIYEATTGFDFDFSLLFKNFFFWLVLILQLAYAFLCIIIKIFTNNADDEALKSINHTYDQIASDFRDELKERIKSGDYIGTKKILKYLKKIKKERRK